ncbi:siderophore-interacting protein [Streptomyces sp. NBC_00335]|uniref:siderophore-interacting protein n=1 Tax=unclassified Streptomyces TaxID=2593676 RepID=UPI002255EF08|nr:MULTISPECIES: siderophore-interacting protein [unclassified Streptomyces]MCX5408822.1 siderophore-interacting protein [Streptomyces sp. NBC_00086]
MAERPARKTGTARVVRTEQLTPHMVRVVLGGEELAGFAADRFTDHYIKLLFAAEGVTYPEPWDMGHIRAAFPREEWPRNRVYTVRAWDPELLELSVDFVVHGEEGLAGPWAARVQPGERVYFIGPGGSYAPEPTADWHLLAGDESALPAIAVAMERMPRGATVHAFIEVSGPAEEQKVVTPDGVVPVWLHRGERPIGEALLEAVTSFAFPDGTPDVFVHGEAGFVKELRRHLRQERQVPREHLSLSGYWRQGQSDEAWSAVKRDWHAQVETEQEA